MPIEVRVERYDAPVVQQLIREMADDLAQFYGPGSYPPEDPARWSPPGGAVLVAYSTGEPAACGAVIRFDDTTGELKRMFTRPERRRRGFAALLLSGLERFAWHAGYRRMILETGTAQLAAQAFYTTAGYSEIPCWPPHDADPTSICFGRHLSDPDSPEE